MPKYVLGGYAYPYVLGGVCLNMYWGGHTPKYVLGGGMPKYVLGGVCLNMYWGGV